MNITKRLYAYPILSEEKDDYISSVFDVELKYEMHGVNHLRFDYNITMDNPQLQQLLDKGKAEYVIHMECSNTAFRKTINTITEQVIDDVPVGRLNGKLEIILLIVCKENIKGFINDDWNDDYAGLSFNLAKGSVLAYKNLPSLDIVKNFEELSSTNSIFMFISD